MWNLVLLLLLLLVGIDVFEPFGHVMPCVNAQFSLWADRHLITRILESMPFTENATDVLKCPKNRPDIQKLVPEEFFLVFNGMLLFEVLDKIALSAHRPIPPRIDVLRARWQAGIEKLAYTIELTSRNQTLLHKPLLNIATSGFVPSTASDVRITLPCTGKASGIAAFSVHLDVRREFEGLRKIPPISFVVHKHCLSNEKQTQFIIKCGCRAKCSRVAESRKRCIRQCRRQFSRTKSGLHW